MSGCLEVSGNALWTQWRQECLAHLLKLICEFGTMKRSSDDDDDVFASSAESDVNKLQIQKKDGQFRVRYKSTDKEEVICIKCLSSNLMSIVNVNLLLEKLLHISYQATLPIHGGQSRVSGGEVVHHAVSLLVSAAFTDGTVRSSLLRQSNFKPWLQQLVLLAKEPSVRFEACRGLYRLSLIKENSCLIQLMDALLDSLPLAQSLQSRENSHGRRQEPSAREYFAILCRLVDGLPTVEGGQKDHDVDLDSLAKLLAKYIRDCQPHTRQKYGSYENEGLSGMLKLCTAVMRHDPSFKMSSDGLEFLRDVFHSCLFALPEDCCDERDLPLCKSKLARSAAFDLLLEMARGCQENFLEVQKLLLKHHSSDGRKRSSYGWHYWPHDNGRSPCGLVGMINLGATCYMASCMQQLYMMPQARAAILNSRITVMLNMRQVKERLTTLKPSAEHTQWTNKPLNTGEQKDMTEFFTDLIGKIEEMSPALKVLVRDLFCGEISNNVVSLDCSHVSKTREEFYSVRCTVADMKSLYESLDEVTIKDTLDGDNMYTCSQCGKKVRAEKRACFQVLPRILCFNTMRYAFNMVTMMKEKVNTHFSFPLQLNMAPYTEDFLMGDKQDQDPQLDPSYWYQLIGVVVHTVKPFDPAQIASECFGGEMTTKTYDAVTEKFMDFSFEKTHSAYMLFYERCDPNEKDLLAETPNIELNQELADWIGHDNIQFLHDKHVFDTTYFNFMWLICSNIPPSVPESREVVLSNVQLGTSFLLETLVHAKEKLLIKNWADLLLTQYEQSFMVCQWFLQTLASEEWLLQVLVKCPIQSIRHMFVRLCLDVIQILRPLYATHADEEADVEAERTYFVCISGFVKAVFRLLEQNIKAYVKNLSEVFWFIHQFAVLGSQEREFLLKMDAISVMAGFYLGTKASELNESTTEEDDDGDDDDDEEVVTILPEDKYRVGSLEKMISVMALLVEESRGERQLHLSENDLAALTGGKGFPFLFQVIKDSINLRHTTNLIFGLCRYNLKLAESIISLLMSSVQKLPPEQSHSFFKLLSMLTEMQGGPPGMPSFTNLTLQRIWEAAEYNAALCIDWLTCMAPKNRMAHQWVLDNMDKWVEKYLIADNSLRIRNASAYLLVSLVPNNHFRQGFRSRSFSAPHKEMVLSKDALSILHEIFKMLLNLLPRARKYCDRNIHGTTKLVSYFAVLNYCLVSRTEKEIFTASCTELWRLFHPLMSEPNIAVHPNKQALLIFWFHACVDCEENIDFITENGNVAANIPLNYILSSDEPEVVTFNRNVLPAYYGLLRLCCEHSRTFTRQLAIHSNMKWAFENLTIRMNQYPQAVEELFSLMRLFAGLTTPDSSKEKTKEEEAVEATFRRDTIILYQSCLDGGASWTTLISAYKILLQTEEDRLTVVVNQGLLTLADAFTTLHMINKPDVRSSIVGWSERFDVAQKLLSLLNSYTPKEVRQSCLDVLNAMFSLYPNDITEALIPIINASHQHWNKTSPPGLLGPYFPRRHTKVIVSSKSVARPAVPELNMFLHPSFLDSPKGVEESHDRVVDHVIVCSCLLAVEAIPLHFTFFSKLWMEVYQKGGDNAKYKSYIQQLCQQPEFLEYVDLILLDERESLNVRDIYTFLCCFFPRTLVATVIADKPVAEKACDAELCAIAKRLTAELRAMSLLFSVRPPLKSDVSALLQPSLGELLVVCRKYQAKKQEIKSRPPSESEQQQPSTQQQDKEGSSEERKQTEKRSR
ncbi:Ubiquitin carboxyl-terminal hydrolase 34 [Desmophyllum pertusum]|uniref:Ubiquitin carboxyl-terminal hydrolase 34 n=1 Tax=Desmophyllum pertusum TaxID=174260 RepID=A0A9X0D9Q1_9CNID|nr:Ubiquitin carboxyl-terminal hydrolase 34 [Desmophyllum pertusum]